MKRTMALMIAVVMAFSLLLTGCGENLTNKNTKPTASPKVTEAPVTAAPDLSDGMVKDDDGIITDQDSGAENKAEEKEPIQTTENKLLENTGVETRTN